MIEDIGIEILHGQIAILDKDFVINQDTRTVGNFTKLNVDTYNSISIKNDNSSGLLIGPKTRVILFEDKDFKGRSYIIDNNTENYNHWSITRLFNSCDFDEVNSVIIPETFDYYLMTPLVGYEGFGNIDRRYDSYSNIVIVVLIVLLIFVYLKKSKNI